MAKQHSKDEQPREFFAVNARYLIDPASRIEDLLNDATCLFGAGLEALEADADSLGGACWSALYTLRQAKAVLSEFLERLPPEAFAAIRAADERQASAQ